MLVYGDAHFTTQLQPLRGQLCRLAARALAAPADLDLRRSLLIVCGQVEQGAHDALEERLPLGEAAPLAARWHEATAHAAEAFYALAYCQPQPLPHPLAPSEVALRQLLHTLESLESSPDLAVTVKLPEGFSLHVLYPEQHLAAAGLWLADHAGEVARGAVVVGVRSIGTTLAAVVSTVLRAAGWQVRSCTVRPGGHPFARQATLGALALDSQALGLVVDEGPGISGSSLAAAAVALVEAGLPRANIALLPGHGNGPGGAGSEEVQGWWRSTPCYVAGSTALSFGGRSLHNALASILPEPASGWEDLSGGVWRQHVYPTASEWPAICTAFERVKYRCTLASGRQVLFKFMGLAAQPPDLASTAEAAAGLLRRRAAKGLAPPALGTALGFVASEWLPGAPLPAAAAPPNMAARLGHYIAHVAGPPLSGDELPAATARLREMLVANTQEALGDEAAAHARRIDCPAAPGLGSYGDGHMQPHEWIVRAGEPFKVDSVGHDCDHTLVGKQPVVWDVAGAVVEWRLDADDTAQLLRAFGAVSGEDITAPVLRFYQAAYLALRAGQCALAAQVHDPYERNRLLAAYARYREQLSALIATPA